MSVVASRVGNTRMRGRDGGVRRHRVRHTCRSRDLPACTPRWRGRSSLVERVSRVGLGAAVILALCGSISPRVGLTPSVALASVVVVARGANHPIVRLAVANVIALSIALCAIEVGVRVADGWTATRATPVPYAGAPYLDDEFTAERQRFIAFTGSGNPWSERDDGRGDYRANGVFDGDSITIIDGVRTTTGQPRDAGPTIWMLGGSTMLCGEVPDEWTIASLVQQRVNSEGRPWRVVNLGVNAASVHGSLAQLRGQAVLSRGDIVVIYGGVNNVRGLVDEGAQWQRAHEMLTSRLVEPWRTRSKLLQWIDDVVNTPKIAYSGKDMETGSGELLADLLEARETAVTAGARLMFVLQPNLFVKRSWSDYEADDYHSGELEPMGLGRLTGPAARGDSNYTDYMRPVFRRTTQAA